MQPLTVRKFKKNRGRRRAPVLPCLVRRKVDGTYLERVHPLEFTYDRTKARRFTSRREARRVLRSLWRVKAPATWIEELSAEGAPDGE